jgi:hypothetical protein
MVTHVSFTITENLFFHECLHTAFDYNNNTACFSRVVVHDQNKLQKCRS